MGKNFETKRRILRLLSVNKKTLTEMSAELKLAPSTISQHIKELLFMGEIEHISNGYAKKWKYYRKASKPVFDIRERSAQPSMIELPRANEQFSYNRQITTL